MLVLFGHLSPKVHCGVPNLHFVSVWKYLDGRERSRGPAARSFRDYSSVECYKNNNNWRSEVELCVFVKPEGLLWYTFARLGRDQVCAESYLRDHLGAAG